MWTEFDFFTALVPPPENVKVQATSNSSVVLTWTPSEGEIDGYVVKYIHEPTAQSKNEQHQSDMWQERSVPDKTANYVEITGLLTDKPYAFCVLAVRESVREMFLNCYCLHIDLARSYYYDCTL